HRPSERAPCGCASRLWCLRCFSRQPTGKFQPTKSGSSVDDSPRDHALKAAVHQALHLTAAALSISPNMKPVQAAPTGEPGRSCAGEERGVIIMRPSKLKIARALSLTVGLLAAGPGVLALPSAAAEPPARQSGPPPCTHGTERRLVGTCHLGRRQNPLGE